MAKHVKIIWEDESDSPVDAEVHEVDEFITSAGVDWEIPKPATFTKSGQEIHKKDSGKVIRLRDCETIIPLTENRISILWKEAKQKIRSLFVKPKRDAFIASFFNDDDYDKSHYA